MHKLSGVIEARQSAQCGDRGHRARALDAPQRLEGLDDGLEAPGCHLRVQCVFQTLEACGLFGHGVDIFLKHNVLCRGGTDHLTEPAEMGWAPGGLARVADIVAQEKGFEAMFGGLEIAQRIFTGTTESRMASSATCGT